MLSITIPTHSDLRPHVQVYLGLVSRSVCQTGGRTTPQPCVSGTSEKRHIFPFWRPVCPSTTFHYNPVYACGLLNDCLDTRLADRSGSLEKERAEAVRYAQNLSGSKDTDTPKDKKYQSSDDSPGVLSGLDPLLTANQDLATAQKAREELSNKLEQATGKIDTLSRKLNTESQRVADLAVERTQLQIRLRDRDEELRGKAKLLDVRSDLINTFNLIEMLTYKTIGCPR